MPQKSHICVDLDPKKSQGPKNNRFYIFLDEILVPFGGAGLGATKRAIY